MLQELSESFDITLRYTFKGVRVWRLILANVINHEQTSLRRVVLS